MLTDQHAPPAADRTTSHCAASRAAAAPLVMGGPDTVVYGMAIVLPVFLFVVLTAWLLVWGG